MLMPPNFEEPVPAIDRHRKGAMAMNQRLHDSPSRKEASMMTARTPCISGALILAPLILSVLATPTAHAQLLPTNGSVASRLGPLELETGYPTDATVAKVFDDIDFQRGCQAYLWALPIMAMQQWQSEHLTKFGAGKLDYVDYLTFQDKLGLLTANATTPYIMAFPNLKETGPLVFEVPAGPTAGGFTDFWQRPITDSGQTGPDKGAGGRYLILGADPSHLAGGSPMERRTTAWPRLLGRTLEDHPRGTGPRA